MTQIPDERPQRRREYSGAGSTLGLAALIVLVVGLGLWFFEFRGSPGSGGAASNGYGIVALPAELNPGGKEPAAEGGRIAPDFRLQTPSGDVRMLSQYRGKTVLINFWASWCPPCRGETPDLQGFFERYGAARDFMILGINEQETAADARTFADQFGVGYPILLDTDGGVGQAYRVSRGLPISILVSPAGVVQQVYFGRITADDLTKIAEGLG
ncbi:MAG: redoxin domain-containing protein [Dehalococcoidia bacterium]|nr:redoxin domain-containing protein [Dehalococcoidia bacterium]